MAAPDIHSREGFEAFISTLPATTINPQWEALVAKVARNLARYQAGQDPEDLTRGDP